MLEGKKVAVFDAEIKNTIESLSKGWKSYDEMGVSILVIFDYQEMRYRVFDDLNISGALRILTEYDYVVGFNTVGFDWKLIQATYPIVDSVKRLSVDYDILREIWVALGLDPDNFYFKTHGGYKLDDVAYDTIGITKSGAGTHAPLLYQGGRFAELADYCIQDVKVEKELFEFVLKNGYVNRNKNGKEQRIGLFIPEPLLRLAGILEEATDATPNNSSASTEGSDGGGSPEAIF